MNVGFTKADTQHMKRGDELHDSDMRLHQKMKYSDNVSS